MTIRGWRLLIPCLALRGTIQIIIIMDVLFYWMFIIIRQQMKSKRKQINKFKQKQDNIQSHHNQDHLKRSSGFKPFHLHKVRHHKRGSLQLPDQQNCESIVYQSSATQCREGEKNDVYLDLIIKKKLLIDGQFNQRLMSERKSIVYLDNQKKIKEQVQEQVQGQDNETLIDFNSELLQTQQKVQPQNSDNSIEKNSVNHRKKKRNKCQCCLQLEDFTSQAVICKNSSGSKFILGQQFQRSNSQKKLQNIQQIDPKQQLKLVTERALKSPFSFTNIKWRSKSQILQVDKWKEKYGRSPYALQNYPPINKSKSTAKIMNNERQRGNEIKIISKKKKNVQRVIKHNNLNGVVLPSINRQQQFISNPEKNDSSNNKQLLIQKSNETQKMQIYQTQIDACKQKDFLFQSYINQNPTKNYIYSDLLKKQNEIVIKEMYSKTKRAQNDQVKLSQKLLLLQQQLQKNDRKVIQQEKQKKRKKSKSKFPQITVTKFYSTMQNDEEKKKSKYLQFQKIANSWKQKPPKKVFLQKMMEQIPERWEYGQSRDNSRQVIEVDYYVKFKREQQINKKMEQQIKMKRQKVSQQKAQEQKMILDIGDMRQSDEQVFKVTNK